MNHLKNMRKSGIKKLKTQNLKSIEETFMIFWEKWWVIRLDYLNKKEKGNPLYVIYFLELFSEVVRCQKIFESTYTEFLTNGKRFINCAKYILFAFPGQILSHFPKFPLPSETDLH